MPPPKGEPVRSSRRAAPVPRDGQCRGTCNEPSIFPGRSGPFSWIPSSGNGSSATTPGRPGSQDRRAQARRSWPCIVPSSWPVRIRMPCPADDVFRYLGARPSHEADASGQQRAAAWPNGSMSIRWTRLANVCTSRTSARPLLRVGKSSIDLLREASAAVPRAQIRPAVSSDGMGATGRCMATGKLGSLSRRGSTGEKNAALGDPAHDCYGPSSSR